MEQATVLLADDETTLRENLAEVLEEEGFHVIACRDGTSALKALKTNPVDAIITDLRMPGVTGMDLIDQAVKLSPEAVIIVITAFGEVETAVQAMKKGVRDYICKPLILDEVIFKLKRLLAQDDLSKENKVLRDQLRQRFDVSAIVGQSPAIAAIRETVLRISNTMSNILICGESGTGKEVVARAIHYSGMTAEKPFVAVNCGGLADTLVESELFGYPAGPSPGRRPTAPATSRPPTAERFSSTKSAISPSPVSPFSYGRSSNGPSPASARAAPAPCTFGSSPRPTAIYKKPSTPRSSARTSTIDCTSSASRFRRCANDAPTSLC
jgi:FixJ family two-component response regulator